MAASPGFIFGGNTGVTPEDLKRRRAYNDSLIAAGSSTAPVQGGWVEAISRVLQGGVGGYFDGQDARTERAARAASRSRIDGVLKDYFANSGSALAYDPAGPSAAASSLPPSGGTAAPAASVDLSGDKKTFVDTLMPAALEASQRTGVDPRIIVAQAAQETGWGKSAPGNNFFGIKSHGKGGGQTLATEEVVNGQRVKVRDSFRSFASPGDSVAGYADFLLENPRYGKMRAAQGLDAQLEALGASGYATDPNYAGSVGAIARSLALPDQRADTSPAGAQPSPQANAGPLPDTRTSVMQAMNRLEGAGAAQPVQVASMDPSIGMDTALAYNPRGTMDGPNQTATVANAPAPLPPARTVEANPAPPAASDMVARALAGLPQNVQQAAQADTGFDGFAQSGRNVQGAPAAPAAPSQSGVAERLTAMLMPDPSRPQSQSTANQTPAMERIIGILSDPWASDGDRQMVSYLMKDSMDRRDLAEKRAYEASDPDNAMKRRYMQAQIDALGAKQPNTTDDIREYQFAQQGGYAGSFAEWQLAQKKAGASSTTVNTGSDSGDFYKEADKARGKSFNDMADAGATAQRSLIQIDELDKRLANVGTGGLAAMKQLAGSYGLPVGDLSDSQAATALIDALIPAQRPPGSGSMSDGDVAMFRRSLPSIINQPGGNALIVRTLKGIAQYDAQRGDLANRVLDREISPAEGRRMMAELPNPLTEFRQMGEQGGGTPGVNAPAPTPQQQMPAAAPDAPTPSQGSGFRQGRPGGGQVQAAPQRARNPQTGQVIEFRDGQWVPAR